MHQQQQQPRLLHRTSTQDAHTSVCPAHPTALTPAHHLSLQVEQPTVHGRPAPACFRHAAVAVDLRLAPLLHVQLASDMPSHLKVEDGEALLIIGGAGKGDEVFSGQQLQLLWLSQDSHDVVWSRASTSGDAPGPHAQHTANVYSNRQRIVLFGTAADEDPSAEELPAVYSLELSTLQWSRHQTSADTPEDNPGWRLLHLAVVRQAAAGDSVAPGRSSAACSTPGRAGPGISDSPATLAASRGDIAGTSASAATAGSSSAGTAGSSSRQGSPSREELVVVGGSVQGALVEMVPFSLDLSTFRWRRSAGGCSSAGCLSQLVAAAAAAAANVLMPCA